MKILLHEFVSTRVLIRSIYLHMFRIVHPILAINTLLRYSPFNVKKPFARVYSRARLPDLNL